MINYDDDTTIGSISFGDKCFISLDVVTASGVKYFQWLYGDSIEQSIPLDESILDRADAFD